GRPRAEARARQRRRVNPPVALRWRAARRRTIHGTIAGFSPGPCRAGALAHRLAPWRDRIVGLGRPAPTSTVKSDSTHSDWHGEGRGMPRPPGIASQAKAGHARPNNAGPTSRFSGGLTRELAEAGQAIDHRPSTLGRACPAPT